MRGDNETTAATERMPSFSFSNSAPPSLLPSPLPPHCRLQSLDHDALYLLLLSSSSPSLHQHAFDYLYYTQPQHCLHSLAHPPKPLNILAAATPYPLPAQRVEGPSPDAALAARAHNRLDSTGPSATRCLAAATAYPGDADMATFAPSSPPDLSSSRSSTKSSSLQSSPFANDDYNDLSHFEDISLAENTPPARPVFSTNAKQRPLVRPLPTTTASPHPSVSSPNLSADLRAPVSRNSHARNFKSPASPRSNWRRGMSSPAMAPPSFIATGLTPSPNTSAPFPLSPRSPRSPGRLPPQLRTYERAPVSPLRRSSWQQNRRKTTEELEQEYHDSDEELPEDAIVWNVPLTPRPVESRSQSTSPERLPPKPNPPAQKVKPLRSKSWTDAMGDLSEEVKALTAALEVHAGSSVDQDPPQGLHSPPRPTLKHHAKSMNLPVRRGHAMIDPLPISKEKEKFLTRTRPSWLPPKCPKEERKHLKEWDRMMSSYLSAEKRKAASENKSKASLERQNSSAAQLWETQILPGWNAAMRSPQTREMWWRGVPGSVRGKVWTKAIGNDLELSPASYLAALKRASASEMQQALQDRENESQADGSSTSPQEPAQEDETSRQAARMARSILALNADIAITFPSLSLFQEQQSMHQSLANILKAYAAYRSDTGYVRGTSGVAALLLLNLTSQTAEPSQDKDNAPQPSQEEAESKAFIALSNLLNKPPMLGFCLSDESAKLRLGSQVRAILGLKLPRLAEHLARIDLDIDGWLTPMVQSLFTTLLDHEAASRVWDVLLFEGDVALVRVVVGLLRCLEGALYGDANEVADILGWKGWVSRMGTAVELGVSQGPEAVDALSNAARWAGRRDEPVDPPKAG